MLHGHCVAQKWAEKKPSTHKDSVHIRQMLVVASAEDVCADRKSIWLNKKEKRITEANVHKYTLASRKVHNLIKR